MTAAPAGPVSSCAPGAAEGTAPGADGVQRPLTGRTVLVASTAIPAHALNATRVVTGLTAGGARVLWSVPAYLEQYARTLVGDGVRIRHEVAPAAPAAGAGPRALGAVRTLYRDALVGGARALTPALEAILAEEAVDLVVADTLNFAAGVAAEATGTPWVSLGDGPLQWPDPELPPFGTGLPVLPGPAGRHRNRHVKAAIDRWLFADALADLNAVRGERGLWPVADLLTAGVSRWLHLQGCVPGFEYPRAHPPTFVLYVGALGPQPGCAPPVPDPLTRSHRQRPLGFVTQGTLRPDPRELVDPATQALLAEGFDVLVAGTSPSDRVLARAAARVRAVASVDYRDALREADVVVTNGGYTGVTLALAAGTPIVLSGATEEKPDIGARLRACGAGEAVPRTRPGVRLLRRLIRRALADPGQRAARRALAAEFAAHDTEALVRAHVAALLDDHG